MTRRMSQISTQQGSVDKITHIICKKHTIMTCVMKIFRDHYINFYVIKTVLSYSHHSQRFFSLHHFVELNFSIQS